MAILPIVTGVDAAVLRTKTAVVPKVTKEIKQLITNMQDTVAKAQGAGIAGPQVGQSLRLCLALIGKKMVPLINPHITWYSKELCVMEEGCLSLPNVPWRHIERPKSIIVTYTDVKGKNQERKLTGYDARVVQHEVDHLEGILIVDYADIQPSEKSSEWRNWSFS